MKPELNKLFQLLAFYFKAITTQSDYKKLNQYIIRLNQQKCISSIANLLSLSLKEMLDYRLFALSIKNANNINVWLHPKMYKHSLEKIIMNDFNLDNTANVTYLNYEIFSGNHKMESKIDFTLENLVSYDLYEERCQAKIYILPKSNMDSHHDEIVQMLMKSAGIALSKQINIETLKEIATFDPLTGCYNRGGFENQIKKNIALARRHKEKLSIFMFDIDYFKKVNDTYGHQVGDDVLKTIVNLIKNNIRSEDILARYGGEEFIVILPSTGKSMALKLAKRLRSKIEKKIIKTQNGHVKVTASFGVASFMPLLTKSQLIQNADAMMYRAKLNGRNLVVAQYPHR